MIRLPPQNYSTYEQFVLEQQDIGPLIVSLLDTNDVLTYRILTVRTRSLAEVHFIERLQNRVVPLNDTNFKTLSSFLNISTISELIIFSEKDKIKLQQSNIKKLYCIEPKTKTSLQISFLTALTSIDLTNCRNLETICSLKGFTNLTNLNLTCCSIKNCTFPSSLEALSFNATAKDFSTYTFTNLTYLSIFGKIDGLPCLGKSLQTLYIRGRDITNITRLEECTNLKDLTIIECGKIEEFSSLKKLNLKMLIVATTKFNDLKVLEKSKELSWLDILGCKVKNLHLLTNFQNLTNLALEHNFEHPYDYTLLKDLPKLKDLTLKYFTNIEFVEQCTSLKNLGLVDCDEVVDYENSLRKKGITIHYDIIQ